MSDLAVVDDCLRAATTRRPRPLHLARGVDDERFVAVLTTTSSQSSLHNWKISEHTMVC
jgi:hypothetical protein